MIYSYFVPVEKIEISTALKLPNSKGKNKMRAFVTGGSGSSNIYVEKVKKPNQRPTIINPLKMGRFLPLQVKQKGDLNTSWILVNIRSLAKRSGISTKQLRAEYSKKNGDFEQLINKTLATSESDKAKKQERKKAKRAKKAKKAAKVAKAKEAEDKKAAKLAEKKAAREARKVAKQLADVKKPIADINNPLDTSLILPDVPLDQSGVFGYASLPMEPPSTGNSKVHSRSVKKKSTLSNKASKAKIKKKTGSVQRKSISRSSGGSLTSSKKLKQAGIFEPLGANTNPALVDDGKKRRKRNLAALNNQLPVDRSFMIDDNGDLIFFGKGKGN